MTSSQGLLWLYVLNASLLIAHEIDSAYWKEWRLFWGLLGPRRRPLTDTVGESLFVLLHVPLVAAVLWGLLEVARRTTGGLVMSILLAASGLFAFTVHTILNRAGHPEFRTAVSRSVLWGTLVLSTIQLIVGAASVIS
jgi:hypothetical protein